VTALKQAYHHGDLRTALLESALTIIEDTGPQGLTIREVARRAGVSHAAPYRHFEDKDDLILAVVEQGFELMYETMQQAKRDAGDDPLDQFAAGGMAYFDFAMEFPAYYRVMFSGDLISTSGQESLQHTSNSSFEQMMTDLRLCQELGVVRGGDPMLQAIAIVSTVHGFVSLANDNRISSLVAEKYTMAQLKEFVMTSIFEGLSAS
jgi:AcrR family transcriptional regulator